MNSSYFLRLQAKSFKLLGFDIGGRQKTFKRPAIAMVSVLPLFTYFGPMLAYMYDNRNDIDEVTQIMGSVLITVLAMSKFSIFVLVRHNIGELLANLRQMLDKEWRENRIFADIIEDANRRDQTFCKLFSFFAGFAATAANVMPLMKMLSMYLLTGHTEPVYPFPTIYPWDNRNPALYLFSYIWGGISGYAVVIIFACTDTFFNAFIHNLCALLKIAAHKMLHIELNNSEAVWKVLRLHQSTLEISAEFNSCFQMLICVQFLGSSLQLCLIGYQVATNFDDPRIVFNFFTVCAMLTQVYIYSSAGEKLKEESANFADAVYESPWYEVSKSVSSSLHVALMRAQQPCLINGYFFEANMMTFSSIVNTTMSYITMLRSFQ